MTADLQSANGKAQSDDNHSNQPNQAQPFSDMPLISTLVERVKSAFSKTDKEQKPETPQVNEKPGLKEKLSNLTFSQWCYLIAFAWLLIGYDSAKEEQAHLAAVGVITAFGLVRELWIVFTLIWHNPLGKGLIVVLYAATANFALAVSALKINVISGIEPTPFYFTMAFTTLLILPFWIGLASLVFLSLMLVAGNIWLLLSVLVRIVGVRLKVHWEDKSLVFFTMVLRIILIPILLLTLSMVISPYFKQLDVFDEDVSAQFFEDFKNNSAIKVEVPDQQAVGELLQQLENDGVNLPPESKQAIDKMLADAAQTSPEQSSEVAPPAEPPSEQLVSSTPPTEQSAEELTETQTATAPESQQAVTEEGEKEGSGLGPIDRLIANFIYHFETYPHSKCAKEPGQRTLVIDEYSMFVAQRDDGELGFSFTVAPCTPRYSKPKEN